MSREGKLGHCVIANQSTKRVKRCLIIVLKEIEIL